MLSLYLLVMRFLTFLFIPLWRQLQSILNAYCTSMSSCFRPFWTRSSLTALFWSFWIHKLEKQWVNILAWLLLWSTSWSKMSAVFFLNLPRASRLCFGNHCHHSLKPASALLLSWCPCIITWSLSSTLPAITSGQDCYRADKLLNLPQPVPTWPRYTQRHRK